MKKFRYIIFCVCFAMVAAIGAFATLWVWKYYQLPILPDNTDYQSLHERALKAKSVAHLMGLSERYCFFVDYSIPSGTPRLFVWDFERDEVVARTYVMHGWGGGSTDEVPVFSNKPGSNCSALGRFAVTHRHGCRNKTGYYLRGLEFENNTASVRALMIHKAKWVDMNCWRKYIPVNPKCCAGCVTVSTRGMEYIGRLMDGEPKEVLLWNYR